MRKGAALLAILALLGAAGCGDDDGADSPAGTEPADMTTNGATETDNAGGTTTDDDGGTTTDDDSGEDDSGEG